MNRGPAWIVLACAAAACGGPSKVVEGAPPVTPTPLQILALDQLYVLEVAGVPPADTTVAFVAGSARRVIVRHGPPDNNVFAELVFPATVLEGAGQRDSIRMTIHPRPGVYGLEIQCSQPLGPGGLLVFKYPVHFSAPRGAQQRYGSPVQFERALSVARLLADGRYQLLPSTRPAADNLQTRLTESGTYLVVAPR